MTALSSYSTGTVAVSADGTTAVGTSTLWLSTGNVKPGDELAIGHFRSRITDVTDDTHLVITPWPGSTVSGSAYTVWKVSQQRIVGETYARDVDRMVGALNTSGYFVFVDIGATAPDPSLGDDGQFAFQPTTGKTWAKSAGVWTFLGVYKAFNLTGAYNGATVYAYGDVQVTAGSSYIYINATPGAGHTAPNPTYWQLLASIGATGNTGSTGAGYGGTSTTSLAIGTGSKVFTTQAGLAYTNGARVRASSAANTANWMEGRVTYSGTTLTMTADKTGGSGTLADWNLNATGEPGVGDLLSTNNLSDLSNKATSRNNLAVVGVVKKQIFTSSGTYTPSANLLYAIIEAVGGGAGGGGSVITSAVGQYTGGGGGAGGYSRTYATAAAIGASQSVIIGAAGSGGAGATNGGAGGNTSVGTLCVANGGIGGQFGSVGQFGFGGAGGTPGTGDVAAGGGGAGTGVYSTVSPSTYAFLPSGAGGNSAFGGGGKAVLNGAGGGGSTAGVAGAGYGAGGSGSASQQQSSGTTSGTGGAGTAGVVLITEFCSS